MQLYWKCESDGKFYKAPPIEFIKLVDTTIHIVHKTYERGITRITIAESGFFEPLSNIVFDLIKNQIDNYDEDDFNMSESEVRDFILARLTENWE